MRDRVSNESSVAHDRGKAGYVKVAGPCADAGQIRAIRRGERPRGNEVSAFHQLGCGWPENDGVKWPATADTKTFAVQTLRRRGHAQQVGLWIGPDDAGPLAGNGVVGLVDDDQVWRWVAWIAKPSRKRLDRRNLDEVLGAGVARRDDPMPNTRRGQLGTGLPDQLPAMGEHQDPPASSGCGVGDGREDDRLPGATGEHQQGGPSAGEVRRAGICDDCGLIGPQDYGVVADARLSVSRRAANRLALACKTPYLASTTHAFFGRAAPARARGLPFFS